MAITIDPSIIEVGERHRALSNDAVTRLAASMKDIGLRHPISVRIVDDYVTADGEVSDGVPVLVAGAHRLAAAKVLGWSKVDCVEVEDDDIAAELWELAENLHRCDLTTEQKHKHIRRFAELLEAQRAARQVGLDDRPVMADGRKSGPQHEKSIATEIAEKTGVSARQVRRVLADPVPLPTGPREPEDAYNKWAGQMDRLFGSVSLEWRERWLASAEIPVMDRRYA